jgi:hypothetical protein
LYDGANKVKGFKIDFRILFDADGVDYDVGAGEAARNNDNAKLYHDLGKLLREGKDVLDSLLLNTNHATEVSQSGACMMQVSGLQAELSSIHLAGDGLYVAVPQGKLCFPSLFSSLTEFSKSLRRIFLFVVRCYKCTRKLFFNL